MARLLIVDDDEDFANAAATVLGRAGHEVSIELTTGGALSRMEETRPDLLILDVMFPESVSGGLELAHRLRHREDYLREIPILLLTALNSTHPLGFPLIGFDDDRALGADFLEKPTDFVTLREKVATLVAAAGRDGQEVGSTEDARP